MVKLEIINDLYFYAKSRTNRKCCLSVKKVQTTNVAFETIIQFLFQPPWDSAKRQRLCELNNDFQTAVWTEKQDQVENRLKIVRENYRGMYLKNEIYPEYSFVWFSTRTIHNNGKINLCCNYLELHLQPFSWTL